MEQNYTYSRTLFIPAPEYFEHSLHRIQHLCDVQAGINQTSVFVVDASSPEQVSFAVDLDVVLMEWLYAQAQDPKYKEKVEQQLRTFSGYQKELNDKTRIGVADDKLLEFVSQKLGRSTLAADEVVYIPNGAAIRNE